MNRSIIRIISIFQKVTISCTAVVINYNYNEQRNQRGKQYLMEPVMGLI